MLHGADHNCRKCVPDSIEALAYGERQQQQPIRQVTDEVSSCCRADKRLEHETHRFEPIIAKRVSKAVQTPRRLNGRRLEISKMPASPIVELIA